MTISKAMFTRTVDCSATVSLVDQGSLYSTGHLSIYNSDMTLISWNALSLPAFATPTDASAVLNNVSDATALVDATASNFAFENRDGTAVWTGNVTVSGGGGSLQLEQISIPKDTTVAIASGIYIVPA